MRLSSPLSIAALVIPGVTAFSPAVFTRTTPSSTKLSGYLDDLSKELHAPDDSGDDTLTREESKLAKEQVDRFGVGDWKDFVDFDEFDGGDGQMGVAGDGKKGLEKEWSGAAELAKSKAMSAKNAWGKSTGYADTLIEQGVEQSRAQQLENWMNQREIQKLRDQQRFMTDEFDSTTKDEDWRTLSKFGVERTQEFDLDETFGAVTVGDRLDGTIELSSRVNQIKVHEFNLRNSFMGYSDFRARFTPDTPREWTVEPDEGSLNGKKGTDFIVKFRPQEPHVSEGYLIIETEDDKWTYKLIGTGSM